MVYLITNGGREGLFLTAFDSLQKNFRAILNNKTKIRELT